MGIPHEGNSADPVVQRDIGQARTIHAPADAKQTVVVSATAVQPDQLDLPPRFPFATFISLPARQNRRL